METTKVSRNRVRRLNTRQRKKLYLGEFQELLFELRVEFRTPLEAGAYYQVWDPLILFIEARGLAVAGLGGRFPLAATDGLIFAANRGSPTDADRAAVLAWLEARPEVLSVAAGEFTDAWHGEGGL
ncbi:MAG: YggL family protein [Uliginosibacterium sp.]|nr:YggL family protein [Uliginosibacterium sp.]